MRLPRLTLDLTVFALAGAGLFFLGLDPVNLKAVFYKLLQLAIASAFAHGSRQILFPYFGIYGLTQADGPPEVRAAAILGLFIYTSTVVAAFMIGL